jgi:hypothetical protein
MSYLLLRLSCAFGGHDWRDITNPFGHTRRCRNCFTERV